jgi:hypothetical protein
MAFGAFHNLVEKGETGKENDSITQSILRRNDTAFGEHFINGGWFRWAGDLTKKKYLKQTASACLSICIMFLLCIRLGWWSWFSILRNTQRNTKGFRSHGEGALRCLGFRGRGDGVGIWDDILLLLLDQRELGDLGDLSRMY